MTAATTETPERQAEDERLHDAVAFLRCHVTLWRQRGQVAALDDWLACVADGSKRQNRVPYKKFPAAVQSAADILRGTEHDQLLAAGYREPGGTETVAVTGHEPVDGTVITSPRPFSSELDPAAEDHMTAFETAHREEDGKAFGPNVTVLPSPSKTPGPAAAPADTPPPVPGEQKDVPAGPGSQDEDEPHETALDEAGQ